MASFSRLLNLQARAVRSNHTLETIGRQLFWKKSYVDVRMTERIQEKMLEELKYTPSGHITFLSQLEEP